MHVLGKSNQHEMEGYSSKWCSCSVLCLCSLRNVPQELHKSFVQEDVSPLELSGFYTWWPAASDPARPRSGVTLSGILPPLCSRARGADGLRLFTRGCGGMGCSSHLRGEMELVVKITRLFSEQQGCVHEKRMLRSGKHPIFSTVLF